jgi:hypothetical protein
VNTQHPCARCGKPVHDNAPCCTDCTREALRGLKHLANLDSHLETTRTRQDHYGAPGPGAAADETPLPVNLTARAVHDRAHRTLARWNRISQHYTVAAAPLTGPACADALLTACPHSSCHTLDLQRQPTKPALRDLATAVSEHLDYLRVRDDARSLFDDIARLREAIERVCDAPPSMIELGPCDQCDTHLRAARDDVFTECRRCGVSYDVAARKAWLITRIDLLRVTPPVIAAVLTAWMEVPLPVATIHTWVNRKRLRARGTDPSTGHPTYRIGDARNLHLASIKRKLKAASTEVPAA